MRRSLMALSTLAVVGALAVGPLAPAAPAQAANPITTPIDTAWDLYTYKLANLPPSMADLVRHNPGKSVDELSDMFVNGQDRWYYQRQHEVLSRSTKLGVIHEGPLSPQEVADAKAQQRSKFRLPAFKPANALKVAAGATVPLFAHQIGLDLVGGALDAVGVDQNEGAICGDDFAPLFDFLTTANCEEWNSFAAAYPPNADVTAGVAWGSSCATVNGVEYCATLMGSVTYIVDSSSSTNDQTGRIHCLSLTPNGPAAAPLYYTVEYPDGTRGGGSLVFPADIANGTSVVNRPVQCPAGAEASYTMTKSGNSYPTNITFPMEPQRWMLHASGVPTGSDPRWVTPTVQDEDPARTITCDIVGSDGNTYSATTEEYHESEGAAPVPQCPALPAGVVPHQATLTENGNGEAPTTLLDEEADPYVRELQETYPECAQGLCTLDLIYEPENESCFSLGETCDGWFSDSDPTKYQCMFGTHPVDLERCNAYRQVFDPELRASGFAYSNPVTGQMQLSPSAPHTRESSMGRTASPADCIGHSVSTGDFWGIIFSPVRCTLVWAFVPDPLALKLQGSNMLDAYLDTPLGELSMIIGGWGALFTASGCAGPPLNIDFDIAGHPVVYQGFPLNACPGSNLHPFVGPANVFFSAFIVIFGIVAVVNTIAGVVGMRKIASGGGDE